jgi:hypothetical protein
MNDSVAKEFVASDLFKHFLAYTEQLSEYAESMYLELCDVQRRVQELGEHSNG